MRVFIERASRIALVVMACVAFAAAGGAPSDYHVTRAASTTTTLGGK